MSKLGNLVDVARTRSDSWYNALTGLGNALRDKLMSTTFLASTRLTDEQVETLYHDEDIAARICDSLPDEALRKGYYLSLENEEESDLPGRAQAYAKERGFAPALKDCAVWSRVFGGATLYLGIDDGQPEDQPVNENGIKSIRFVAGLDKRDLMVRDYYEDPLNDPLYGRPKTYEILSTPVGSAGTGINRSGVVVHESRIIRLDGTRTSTRRRARNGGWCDSALLKINDVLVQFSTGWQGTAHLLQDAAQGVFKIDGLVDMIASGDKDTLQARMEIVETSRSLCRAIMLDAERESFERVAYNFGGVPDVLRSFMLRLAAAAGMPVTVLMGQSPAGLNATGESDTRLWYDTVQAYQSDVLEPAIRRFHELMFLSADFDGEPPGDWEVRFPSLWQMTAKEQAELERQVAEKDKIYIDAGVLLPEEVALNRFKAGGFSAETQIDMDARKEILSAEIELAKSKAGEDPDPPAPIEEPVEVAAARNDYIRHRDGKWIVYSKGGKILGTHDTEAAAKKQLAAIEASKHAGA